MRKTMRSRHYVADKSSSFEKSLQIQNSTQIDEDVDSNVSGEDRQFLDNSVIVAQKLGGENEFIKTYKGYDSCENWVCEAFKMNIDLEGKFNGNLQDILAVFEENVSLKKKLAARRTREEELHEQISKLEYDLSNNADESLRLAIELKSTREKMEVLAMLNQQKEEEDY